MDVGTTAQPVTPKASVTTTDSITPMTSAAGKAPATTMASTAFMSRKLPVTPKASASPVASEVCKSPKKLSPTFTAPVASVTFVASGARNPSLTSAAPTTSAAPVAPATSDASTSPRTRGPRVYGPRVRPRQNRDPNNQNQNPPVRYKIHVEGYPVYTQPQDLMRIFATFGRTRVDNMSDRLACLSFESAAEANAAVQASKKVIIYGAFLTVRAHDAARDGAAQPPPSPRRAFAKSKHQGVVVEAAQLDLATGGFEMQLARVLGAVRLTRQDVAAITALYGDVERVLQALWPGCVVMPFGSITTGLGIKSSDADCFVSVPAAFQSAHANFVNKAKRVLQMYPLVFTDILCIPRANTPIVKFFHIPTKTNCDLSFKTPLGAQNSRLISFLLHADPRLIPVAVLIKYWAKVHVLSGTGKLTNYALTMMIIFYFQQLSILPSVKSLQTERANDVVVDYWNTGIADQPLPPSSNTSSLPELIGGFFVYYSKFDFDEAMICPYLGTPVKKQLFRDPTQLPNEWERYKENVLNGLVMPIRFVTPMCVQDPFEQSHNVASAITSRLKSDLVAYFEFAASAYETQKLELFLRVILLDKPKIIKMKGHPEFKVKLYPNVLATIVDADWKSVVTENILICFERMLKIKLEKAEEEQNPEAKKEKERYKAFLLKPVWKRKQLTRLYNYIHLDFQMKQERITEEIHSSCKQVLDVEFQLNLTFAHEPKNAVVFLKHLSGSTDAFREFGRFYMTIGLGWFAALLRMSNAARGPAPSDSPALAEAKKNKTLENDVKDLNNDNNEKNDDNANESICDSDGENIAVAANKNINDVKDIGNNSNILVQESPC